MYYSELYRLEGIVEHEIENELTKNEWHFDRSCCSYEDTACSVLLYW